MNVACPGCRTVFRVDPAKVPAAGVRARCSTCATVFRVEREEHPPSPRPAPLRQTGPVPAPTGAAPTLTRTPLMPAPAAASVSAPPPAAAPAARPSSPPPPAAPPTSWPQAVPPPFRAERPEAPAVGRPWGEEQPAARSAVQAPRRRTNPFLSQDPAARARRLARALVSDLVVYNPAKRRDGLRDGSLKQLFEEEIRKSWEEYVEQVGREVAESTAYFTDALNEILADGRRIF
ncbi:MAG: zinc-ribbon domain-containing protein [Gemmatimonadales bacterium]